MKGQVLATMDASVAVVSVRFSLSKNPQFLPITELPLLGKTAFMAALFSTWAMATVKLSIAYVLVRLLRTKRWRYFLYAMIGIQCVAAVFNTIMHATRFIPLEGQWAADPIIRIKSQVWSDWAFDVAVTVAASINIMTDIVFSLLPLTFLREIQRPRRDKIIVGGLMALGLVGSSASIVKTITVHRQGNRRDILDQGIRIAIWSILEEQLALIAACVPCLKALFQKCLSHFGLISSSHRRTAVPRAYIDISHQSKRHNRHDEVKSALGEDGAVLANRGDLESQQGIMRVTKYQVESTASSDNNIYELSSRVCKEPS